MISSNDSIRESLPCFCSLYHQLLQLGFHLRKEVNVKVFAKKRIRSKTHSERRWISRCCMVYHGRFVHNQNLFYWDFNGRLGDATSLDFVIIKNLIPFSELILISLFLGATGDHQTEEKLPKTLFEKPFFWITWWFHFSCSRKNCLFLFSDLFSWDDMSFFQISTHLGHPDFLLITWHLKPRHFPRQVLTIIIFAESRPSLARLRMASCARKRLI